MRIALADEFNADLSTAAAPLLESLSADVPCVLFKLRWVPARSAPEFRFISVTCDELLGIPASALLLDGHILFERLASDEVEHVCREIATAFATCGPWHVRFKLRVREKVRWMEWRGQVRERGAQERDAHGYLADVTNWLTLFMEREQALQDVALERDRIRDELRVQTRVLPIALAVCEPNDALTVREWNPVAERTFEYRREEALGRSLPDLIIPADQAVACRDMMQTARATNEVVRALQRNRTRDGRLVWCEWATAAVRRADGSISSIISMIQDVTDRERAQERTRLWTSIMEHSDEGIMICDPQQRILMVNAAFERLTGFTAADAIGNTPRMLHSGRQDPAFYATMWRSIVENGRWSGEIWNRRRSGEHYVEWLTVNAVLGERGEVTHYVGTFSDVTPRKATEARAKHLAEYDTLTELPNRTLLTSRLSQLAAISSRTHTRLGVLYVDLDRFNNVNDSLGHEAGDALLKIVASRLVSAVRASDTVGRMAADEFVVLVPDLRDPSDAANIAHDLLSAISVPFTLDGQTMGISASIGICMYPDDAGTPHDLIRNAVAAMCRAKNGAQNSYEFYTREMNAQAADKLRLENDLRLAIEQEELVLHYQPQIDLGSGAVIGAEALIRWNRPGTGLLQPAEFMPIAEERGLIVLIGRWVIRQAMRQVQLWDAAGMPPLTVSVNVSASEFHQPGFVAEVADMLRDHDLDPARIELELTENIAVQDAEGTAKILAALHALGVRISLDDFGTGYSSLSYLRSFPIDKIKIDQSFIRQLPQEIRIVRAILGLAHSLSMQALAEGVETQEQLDLLRTEHCDQAQGFLLSRAVPADELQRLVEGWSKKPGLRQRYTRR